MNIKKFDFFGTDINFLIGSDVKFNTTAGAIGSTIFVFAFIGVFFSNLQHFFKLQNVKIYEQSYFSPQKTILLTNQNITLAFGIRNHSLINSPHFQFKIDQAQFYGNGTRTSKTFKAVPCNFKKWASLGQQYKNFYDNNKLNQFVCLPDDFKLQVVGQYGNQIYKYLRFSINRCQQKGCSSNSQFRQFVKSIQYLQVNLVYVNSAAQYQNITHPLSYYPQKLYYRFVPLKQKLSIQQFFHKIQITTQKSVLPFQDVHIQSGIFFQRASASTYLTLLNQEDPQFFKILIKTVSYSRDVSREVQSLDQFLSFVGGIFFVIQIIGKLLFQGYAKFKFHQKVFNRTCKFVKSDFKQLGQEQKTKYLQSLQELQFWFYHFIIWKILGWFRVGKKLLIKIFDRQILLMESIDKSIQSDRNIINLHKKLNFLQRNNPRFDTRLSTWKFIISQRLDQFKVHSQSKQSSRQIIHQLNLNDIANQPLT